MHISNGATFEEVTQVCSYSQQKNITLWMLGYERSTSLEMMVPRIGEVWNDAIDQWKIETKLQYSICSLDFSWMLHDEAP